jgi:hypothetical protein
MCLSSIENPSGSIRCSVQPVLAASRITLPVLGGISGSTRTMWNMRGLSPVTGFAGAGSGACFCQRGR